MQQNQNYVQRALQVLRQGLGWADTVGTIAGGIIGNLVGRSIDQGQRGL